MIDEEAIIKHCEMFFPFGIEFQKLWELILANGGNEPFVTKDILNIALAKISIEDFAEWKKERNGGPNNPRNRHAIRKYWMLRKWIETDPFTTQDCAYRLYGIRTDKDSYNRHKNIDIEHPINYQLISSPLLVRKKPEKFVDEVVSRKVLYSTRVNHLQGLIKQLIWLTKPENEYILTARDSEEFKWEGKPKPESEEWW